MAPRGSIRVLIEAASDGSRGAASITAALTSVMGTIVADEWEVESLFEGGGPLFLLVGSPRVPPTAAAVYQLTHLLLAQDGILRAEPDLPVTAYAPEPDATDLLGAFARPEPTPAEAAWALEAISCEQAWRLAPSRGAGIRIGHPDTGYTPHWVFGDGQEALDLHGDHDFVDDDGEAIDPLAKGLPLTRFPGHGTGTGGVIVGRGDRDRGCRGVAPAATLVPIRAVNSVIQFFDSDVARAVDHARSRGCHLISMSLGGKGLFGLHAAIDRARRDGMIVMAAAGNHVRIVTSPASYDNCLAIAATGPDSRPWSGSSRGRQVDVSAPGSGVIGAAWDLDPPKRAGRSPKHGTSYAVAHVAGVAALWLAHHGTDALRARYPGRQLQEAFRTIIVGGGHRIPPDWDASRYGVGIIDAEAVVSAALPTLPPGARAAFDEEAPSGAARIAAVFDDLSDEDVVRRVGPEVTDLVASELLYQLMNDAEAAEGFVADAGALGAFGAMWRQRVLSGSSPQLTAVIGGVPG